MTRPRLTIQELELIKYALFILEQLCTHKMKEQQDLPYELKQFARIVWYTGDLKAFQLLKPYKQYVEAELRKDFGTTYFNAHILKRRIEGLLNGRRLHSREFLSYTTSGTK